MKNLKQYQRPSMKVVLLDDSDLICTSSKLYQASSGSVRGKFSNAEEYDDADFD